MFIQALYFPPLRVTHIKVPVTTLVPTRRALDVQRYPIVETVFGSEYRIHDSFVTIFCQGTEYRFLVSYQYNKNLPRNRALKRLLPDVAWRGEMIVMKAGQRQSVTSLRGYLETQMALIAARWYVVSLLMHWPL